MKINQNYHLRHKDIFDPVKQRFDKIVVFGAGSLGSFITFTLAKMGFNAIEVWDFDTIEELNIGTQIYRPKDIGKFKVDALKNIVKEFTDVEIGAMNSKFEMNTNLSLSLNTLYILTFDTLEARRLVFEVLKDRNCICLDVRAGLEEFNIQVINTINYTETKKWDDSFNIEQTNLPCSAKSIVYSNMIIAGEVCNIAKKINNDEKYPLKIMRHVAGYKMMSGFKK